MLLTSWGQDGGRFGADALGPDDTKALAAMDLEAPPGGPRELQQTPGRRSSKAVSPTHGTSWPSLGLRSSSHSSAEHIPLTGIDDLEPSPGAHDDEDEEAQGEGTNWTSIAIKVVTGVAFFVLCSIILEKLAGDKVEGLSRAFIERIGLPGLFGAVLLADGVPQPFTYVPLIYLAVKGDVPKLTVLLVCAGASYTAALCGYGIGYCLRGPSWGRAFFELFKEKYPQVPELMETRGPVGVLLAAMLPMPLAAATWTAGFFGVSFPYFLVAALGRCPKIAVFVLLSRGPTS